MKLNIIPEKYPGGIAPVYWNSIVASVVESTHEWILRHSLFSEFS